MASCSRSSSPLPFRCFGAQDDGCSPSKAEAVGLRRVLWGGAIAGAVALGYTLAVPPGGIAGPHTLMYAPTVLRPALSAQGLARAWARRPGPASARSRPSSSAHAAAPLPDAPTSREVPAPATLTPRSLWPHSVSFAFAVALAAAALSAWRLRPRSPATLEQIGLLSVAGARDRWVDDARSAPAVPGAGPLAGAKTQASELLQTAAVPSARVEDWRFTDLGALQGCALVKSPAAGPGPAVDVTACTCDAAATSRVVLVDGVVARALSDLSGLPDGVYVGPASVAPAPYAGAVADHFARQTAAQGAFFAQLNTALCPDVLCCIVRAGTRVPHPVHVIHVTQGAAGESAGVRAVSAPRLLVVLGAEAELTLLEEFVGAGKGGRGAYLACPTAEVDLAEGAALAHSIVQDQHREGLHLKSTLVRQAARSRYREAEIALGGALARHDLRVVQTGRDTRTALRCFCLVGPGQCHDLHSQVLLDHPGAVVDQLHKQIAAAPSSRGVFDGNIRVARAAQRADAAQLTRSLLLRRGATVNARPNLQIVADDVKCAHGCTVSDLDAEELFYLRARGLTEAQAREALVFSFGCEVLEKVGDGAWGDVTARLQDRIRGNLVGTVGVGE